LYYICKAGYTVKTNWYSAGCTGQYTHVQGEGLAKIYRKYHPQEHDLFDAVDGVYKQRLEPALGVRKIR
jgi:hypothetical protein